MYYLCVYGFLWIQDSVFLVLSFTDTLCKFKCISLCVWVLSLWLYWWNLNWWLYLCVYGFYLCVYGFSEFFWIMILFCWGYLLLILLSTVCKFNCISSFQLLYDLQIKVSVNLDTQISLRLFFLLFHTNSDFTSP